MDNDFQIPNDWTFKDHEVANAFDNHVRESLPWYDLVAGAVAHVVRHYLPENGKMYDIGASTGNIGILLDKSITARSAELVSIESAPEMARHFRAQGKLEIADAVTYDYEPFDVATVFLLLMFLTIPQRTQLLNKLITKCNVGGAIIIVDKIETQSNYLGTIHRRLTLAGKVATGVSPDKIIAKELSLAGIQRPLQPHEIPTQAELFFRYGEFAGWIIQK